METAPEDFELSAIQRLDREISSCPRAAEAHLRSLNVQVSGHPFEIPQTALMAAVTDLRLGSEAHVSLRAYADSMALVLTILERSGVIAIHPSHE